MDNAYSSNLPMIPLCVRCHALSQYHFRSIVAPCLLFTLIKSLFANHAQDKLRVTLHRHQVISISNVEEASDISQGQQNNLLSDQNAREFSPSILDHDHESLVYAGLADFATRKKSFRQLRRTQERRRRFRHLIKQTLVSSLSNLSNRSSGFDDAATTHFPTHTFCYVPLGWSMTFCKRKYKKRHESTKKHQANYNRRTSAR